MRPRFRLPALVLSVVAALYFAAVALGVAPTPSTIYGYGYGYGYNAPDRCEQKADDGSCADLAPSTTTYSPNQPGPSFAGGPGYNAVLTVPAGAFDFPATVTLDPEPPAKGPAAPAESGFAIAPLDAYYDLTVRNSAAGGAVERGGTWDPPLKLTITLPNYTGPDSELLISYYEAGGPNPGWRPIPFLRSIGQNDPEPQLAQDQRDGFFTRDIGFRQITILTRHTTPFAAFRRVVSQSGGGGGDTSTTPQPDAGSPKPPAPLATPLRPARRSTLGRAPSKLVARRNRVVVPCRATAPATRCRVRLTARRGGRVRTIGEATSRLRSGRANVSVRLNATGRAVVRRATRRRAVAVTVRLEALGASGVLTRSSRSARLTRR